jgi:DNA ligase-1
MNTVFDETLYSITKTGATYVWHILVKDIDSLGNIFISRGLINGKKHVTTEVIEKGKNLGKVNATTPVSQAIFNAESKRNNKLDSGYDYTIEGSRAKFNDLLKPMLALSYDKHKKKLKYPCVTQPKLDGIRCLARRVGNIVILYSRKGKVLDLVPHINKALLGALEDGDCADGELYTYGWDFQKIISAIKKTNENTSGIQYWIYDLPNMKNRDEQFSERFSFEKRNKINTNSGGCLVTVESPEVSTEEELMMYEDRYIKKGFEGSMARNKDSKYLFGYRSKDLLKVKRFLDDEYKIVGFTHGVSIESECLIFVCEIENGQTFSVRPIGTHEERKEMYKKGETYMGRLLTVKYQELSNDGVPRFPVGLHIREEWDMS